MGIKFFLDTYLPHQHYLQVEMEVHPKKKETFLSIPTWSPGSYKIRDYAKSIHKVRLVNPKSGWTIEQTDLDTWKVYSKGETFHVSYLVYGYEHTVRTNYFTSEFMLIHPPATFLYAKDLITSEVEVSWKSIAPFKHCYTGLKRKENAKLTWKASNIDELFDSPILLSNEKEIGFETRSCHFDLVVLGNIPNTEKRKIAADLSKVVDMQIRCMGGTENSYYLFILDMTENLYGGLEHLNCSVNQFDPIGAFSGENYRTLIELLSHEYFHHWNVKRIRPIALGPFDYQKPNLTKELWIAEGITSFFDAYFLLLCDIYNPQQYLNKLWKDIRELEESEGESWMSLEESSFTAWTKYYNRPLDPNFGNTGISYYTKGAILSLSFQLFVLSETEGKKSLLDIMRELYKNYYLEKKRGFTKAEFFQAAKKVVGVDLKLEFDPYITEPKRIPIEKYLAKIGIERTSSPPELEPGFRARDEKGRLVLSKINLSKPIKNTDLSTGDEWISIDGIRALPNNFKDLLKKYKPGQKAELLISRRGTILKRKIQFDKKPSSNELWINDKVDETTLSLREIFLSLKPRRNIVSKVESKKKKIGVAAKTIKSR
ncbi:M61 family metallopeptidase [Leptospira broomii]|nr:M61 family metallopeptidase [Leptospira broomii]